ncbi:unnamed protein product [Moneuplotes crassus]|uniref:Uncharacterized protein n=1 Tax=Euplotes crassus TaxID=5936 RepID=A0AAD2CWU8_EUPCR|nr:unnamed protein product [Moneuplotes crassus]
MFRRIIFHRLERFTLGTIAPTFRNLGQNLFKTGSQICGPDSHSDQLVRSMRCVPINNTVYPKLLTADWVAPNATIIGDVEVDAGSSIWHTAVLRGDTAKIRVGKNSLIQDRAILKSSNITDSEISIGDNVFVGPNTQLDACTLDDFSFVGMGATIGRGVVVEPYAVVAAGSVVPEGTVVPSGQVWAGHPAQYLRDLTQEEKHQIAENLIELQQLSQLYCEETEKSFREQQDHIEDDLLRATSFSEEVRGLAHKEAGLPIDKDDAQYISDPRVPNISIEPDQGDRTWSPYEQDLSRFPEIFKMYGENFDRYEQVKKRFETEQPGEQMGEHPINPQKPTDQSPWEKRYDDYMPRHKGQLLQ